MASDMDTIIQAPTYSRSDIVSREFFDELYVFDITCENEIVGARAPHSRLNMGVDPLRWLSYDDREVAQAHLMSYDTRPFLAESETDGKAILIISNLVPSSSLGVLMRLDIDARLALKLARYCGLDVICSEELLEQDIGRLGKRERESSGMIFSISESIDACFGGLLLPKKLPREMAEKIKRRIESISYLVGCPITLKCADQITDYGDLDEGLLCAFVLLSTLLARRASSTRGLDITVKVSEGLGIVVSAEMIADPSAKGLIPELLTMKAIASRKNMFFDFCIDNGEIYMSMAPSEKDWSYIELKSPDYFDWDN